MAGRKPEHDFVRRFESREVLEALLQLAGSPFSADAALERMRDGHARGEPASGIISGLFRHEPRFPDPAFARRLYQNLLGLWDLVESGTPIILDAPPVRLRAARRKPAAPPPFGVAGPDREFVEKAWQYLEDLDKRGLNRLQDAFGNRQDALVGFLEEQGLTDNGFDCARHLVFELFAMIELGWPAGTRNVVRSELQPGEQSTEQAPAALLEYADEAVFEAEQDEESPLAKDEAARIRVLVARCLRALWAARRMK